MSCNVKIIKGDSRPIKVTLFNGATLFPITSGAVIRAGIHDGTTLLTGATTIGEADPGNDWPNSVVGYKPSAGDTAGLPVSNTLVIEIEVVDAGDTTTFKVKGVKTEEGLIV